MYVDFNPFSEHNNPRVVFIIVFQVEERFASAAFSFIGNINDKFDDKTDIYIS